MRALWFLALLLLAGCSKPLPPGVTELVYATPYSPGHPFSKADKRWMDFIKERSGGKLVIKPSWSGAVLSSDQSMTELRHGVADIGLVTPIYAKGGSHLIRIQTGYYSGAKTIESQIALYRCMAASEPELGKEIAGLKLLALQGGTLPGIVTRNKEIKTLADLKGLRIRAPTELLGILRDLGADPVNMPMGEVYPAMAKGVIDGVIAPADTFKALHFAEVAKHYVTLQVPRGAYPSRAMGMKKWNSLTGEQRAILEEGVAVWEKALADEVYKAFDVGLETARKEGVQINGISAADQTRFDTLYLHDAEINAKALSRFGIDGMRSYHIARASIGANGTVTCKGMK